MSPDLRIVRPPGKNSEKKLPFCVWLFFFNFLKTDLYNFCCVVKPFVSTSQNIFFFWKRLMKRGEILILLCLGGNLNRKYKVKSTKYVIFHELHHTYCMESYSKFPLKTKIFNFPPRQSKIKISPHSISLFQKIWMFWEVETQGFTTQPFLYKTDLKNAKIISQTQNNKYFLNSKHQAPSDLTILRS